MGAAAVITGVRSGARFTEEVVSPVAMASRASGQFASESIFTGTVLVDQQQEGCLRFSFVPAGSETPQQYRCQPALEIAAPRRLAQSAGSKPTQPAASVPQVDLSPRSRPAGLVGGLSARQERAAQLLEHSRRLQHELSSLYATSMHLRQRACQLVAHARRASAAWRDIDLFPIANEVVGPLPWNVVALPGPGPRRGL